MSASSSSLLCPQCGGTGRLPAAAEHAAPRQPSLHSIVVFVARRYGVPRTLLISRSRPAIIRRPRRIAMWLLRTLLDLSLQEIGRIFNKADHTSGRTAILRVEEERISNPAFKKETDELVAALHARYPTLLIGARHPLTARVVAAQAAPDDPDATDSTNA